MSTSSLTKSQRRNLARSKKRAQVQYPETKVQETKVQETKVQETKDGPSKLQLPLTLLHENEKTPFKVILDAQVEKVQVKEKECAFVINTNDVPTFLKPESKISVEEQRVLLEQWVKPQWVKPRGNIPWGVAPKIKIRPEPPTRPLEFTWYKPSEPSPYIRCAFCYKGVSSIDKVDDKSVEIKIETKKRQFHFHRGCVHRLLKRDFARDLFYCSDTVMDYVSYYKWDHKELADFKALGIIADQDAIDGKFYCPSRKNYTREVFMDYDPLWTALKQLWPKEFSQKNLLSLVGGKWQNQDIVIDQVLLDKYHNLIEDLYQTQGCYRFETFSPSPFECYCKGCFESGRVNRHRGHKTRACGCEFFSKCDCFDKEMAKYRILMAKHCKKVVKEGFCLDQREGHY